MVTARGVGMYFGWAVSRPQYSHLQNDLWTPLNAECLALIDAAKENSGMSWDRFSREVGYRSRVLRRYRNGGGKRSRQRAAMPQAILDKMLTVGGIGPRISELSWYTTEELVEQGVWKPMVDLGELSTSRKGTTVGM